MKLSIKIAIAFLLFTLSHSRKKYKRNVKTTIKKVSLWQPFECHVNADCSKVKYCRGWKCVPRHSGFCTHDSECERRQRCNLVRNVCVKRIWCKDDSTCDVGQCCARIDPRDESTCHPMTQAYQFCLRKITLCTCIEGFYCKPTSKILGYCVPEKKSIQEPKDEGIV